MKRLFIFPLVFISFIFSVRSQTVDPNFVDGKIYFKISIKEPISFRVEEGSIVSVSEFLFLRDIQQEFGITKLTRPLTLGNDSNLLRYIFVRFDSIAKADLLVKYLLNVDIIEDAGKEPVVRTFWEPNDPCYGTSGGSDLKWFLTLIKADQAWDIKRGSSNIKVAIVDNAVWGNHPDLQIPSNLQYNGLNGNVGNSAPPSNIRQTCTGYNCSGYGWSHGTHCAGLVGAVTNNKLGIASIGGGVTLMGARCSTDGDSEHLDSEAILAGVSWAANNGAKVISMSYGGTFYYPPAASVYQACYNIGIVLVAAAGNDGNNVPNYPAAYPHVIGVASVNSNKVLSDFSNYGDWVIIAAPGGYDVSSGGMRGDRAIFSTTYSQSNIMKIYGHSELNGENYDCMQGTSMACPVVAGLCGLMLSKNPNLTPDQVKQILQITSQPLLTGSRQIATNSGIIDAYAAMQAVAATVPNASFTASTTTGTSGTNITYTNTTAPTPTAISSCKWYFPGGAPSMSTSENPTIAYNTPGMYPVTLVVVNSSNQKDSLVKESFINIFMPDGAPDSLGVDRDTVFVDFFELADGYFNLTSNTNWTIVDTSSWLLVTPASGNANKTITVELNQNPLVEDRISTLTITGEENLTKSVVIKQKGAKPYLNTNLDVLYMPMEGGTSTDLSISSTTNWTIVSNGAWLTISSPLSGYGNQVLTLTASANGTIATRSVTILISTPEGIQKHVTVYQENTPVSLTVYPSTLTLSAVEGAEEEFSITSNTDWNIYEIPSWLKVEPNSGNGNATVTVTTLSANEKADKTTRERNLEIIARNETRKVLVKQLNTLSIDPVHGIEESFYVYPNPFTNVINIENNSSVLIKESFIFDLTGKILLTKQNLNSSKKISMDLSPFSKGIYLLKLVTSEGKSQYKKLIKQ